MWIIRCHICRANLSLLFCWVHALNKIATGCVYIYTSAHNIRIGCLIVVVFFLFILLLNGNSHKTRRNTSKLFACYNFVVDWKITKCWPTQFVEISEIVCHRMIHWIKECQWPRPVYRKHHICYHNVNDCVNGKNEGILLKTLNLNAFLCVLMNAQSNTPPSYCTLRHKITKLI